MLLPDFWLWNCVSFARSVNYASSIYSRASIQKDMKDWDEENIWRISCYGPTGGKPCLPGFEDLSEDEIRYETLMNGGVIPPHLCLPDRIDRIAQMKYKWSLPSVENRNILVSANVKNSNIHSPSLLASLLKCPFQCYLF
jgi:hypothetical protein